MRGAGTCIFELFDGPIPFDLLWVKHSTQNAPVHYDSKISCSVGYPTRSGVNVLEDFNLEVKAGKNVAIVYVISETSRSKLFIIVFAGTGEEVEAESHPYIRYC